MSDASRPESASSPNSASRRKELAETLELLDERIRRERSNRLARYLPYPAQFEFHRAGSEHRYRMFLAGNQLGKTLAGGFEAAIHLTGRYPDWWPGYRFDRPIIAWAAGQTAEAARDNPQEALVGPPQQEDQYGTGAIPRDCLLSWSRKRNVPDALDSVVVQHITGENSILVFKSYDQERAKWQGETLDVLWCDEEPPAEIWSEGTTRTQARSGLNMLTATPLEGMTEVIRTFLAKDEAGAQAA